MKLPVVSSAPQTDFVFEKLEGPGGLHLWLDGNSKISGTPPRPNAFSLVQVKDCPGHTPTCAASCYVHQLEKFAPEVHEKYRHNSDTLGVLFTHGTGVQLVHWAVLLGLWIQEHCATTGFRWHVSGDVRNVDHAWWIAEVSRLSRTPCWLYTRTFDSEVLHHLTSARPWLTVNLSADRDNYPRARYQAAKFGLRTCYMSVAGEVLDDLQPGDVIFPDYSLRAPRDGTPSTQRAESAWYQSLPQHYRRMVCPVDFYGKSERVRCSPQGACNKCLR